MNHYVYCIIDIKIILMDEKITYFKYDRFIIRYYILEEIMIEYNVIGTDNININFHYKIILEIIIILKNIPFSF